MGSGGKSSSLICETYEQEMLQRRALIGSNDWLKHSIRHYVVTKEIISVRAKSHSGSSNISEVTLKRL